MRHSNVAVVVLLVGAGVLGGCGGDDEATVVPGTVVVDDTGSGDTYVLPAAFAVGQTATLSGEFTSSVSVSGPTDDEYSITVSVEYHSEVVELTDDGGAVVESEYVAAAVDASDEGVDTGAFEDLVGVRYRETYAADGSVVDTELVDEDSLSDAQRAAAEDMIGQASTSTITFPTEPVGVGATWASDSTLLSQGVEIVVIDRYELIDVVDGVYTITVEYGSPIDDTVGGEDVTGSISARGVIRGDVENPLAVTAQLRQLVDMSVEGEGTLEMSVDVATRAEGIEPLDEGTSPSDTPADSTTDSTTAG
ncbi:hypothetical protein [Desertimonas flava]|uniref:hypothetical protein n=1 Tax=Desertimonas flava TaxID=2064846 RepID=UPI000E34D9E5|nr:hypothetical protein [Desertimonas flava]